MLEDEVVSMVDVLQEDNELEEEARAVLGDSDDQHCTYPVGYVKRQALYACGTCSPSDAEPAGVCLACTLTCHEGHTLYELYTKRNFRCDCGNKKFPPNFKCKLYPQKDPENTVNKYNQNFRGVYCTCHRPYPDLEDEIEDEMIQCVICEDWYHSRHLGNLPPTGGDFQEMICDDCMTKCSFLQAYLPLSVPQQQTSIGLSQQIIPSSDTETRPDVMQPSQSEEQNTPVTDSEKTQQQKDSAVQQDANKTTNCDSLKCKSSDQPGTVKSAEKEENSTETISNGVQSENTDCKLTHLQESVTTVDNKASYWHAGWRSNLCKCATCMSMYKSLDVLYLTDEADTMMAYEQRGKDKRPSVSAYESGMQALQNMGRIQQVEAMHEYNDMKTELTEYLREFAAQGKVVKEEDIRNFFDSLQSRKRQRVGSANSVQYHCR